jgi:hypothetical protein
MGQGWHSTCRQYAFFCGKWNEHHELGTGFFVQLGIISAVRGVEFVGDRLWYMILSGRWYDIVLNVHAPTEDKTDSRKDSFCEELDRVFDKFPKYHVKILLDFSAIEVEKIFSNPQLGMRVYTKLLLIMEVE